MNIVKLGRKETILDYEFDAAPLGPLSSSLNHILERMKKLGLINEKSEFTPSGNKVLCYSLTKEGSELLDFGLVKFIDSATKKANESIISKYGKMSYSKLLDYVHNKYPEYQIKF